MKRVYILTFVSVCITALAIIFLNKYVIKSDDERQLLVGIMYVGDESTAYTMNFMKAQRTIENEFDEKVRVIPKYNIPEGSEQTALQELVNEKCDIIFGTSYGYSESMKKMAQEHPDIQFCQASGLNANEDPVCSNYHTFMGTIYQGRYICGVVAGMKMRELIEQGEITADQAMVGYVGAYPNAEVISGYTAFLLGVRSVVPSAVMVVKYTNTWNDYMLEKKCAKELIDEGCIVISQHSDTTGPAVACEETNSSRRVYIVSYNQSMADVAPTTYLVGCRVNWTPYMVGAVDAVLHDEDIEDYVKGNVNGTDMGAGFDQGWNQMLELNEVVAAPKTASRIDKLINEFKKGDIHVFKGNYLGVDPKDNSRTYDLNKEYIENEHSSAPTFDYILKDIIRVE